MLLFHQLPNSQQFYLDTYLGRVIFIKEGNSGRVLYSEHYFFDVGAVKLFNKNTQVKIN